MHALQVILVSAENAEDARNKVESRCLDGWFDWSDWSSIGGRWSGELVEGDVLRYSDDPTKFEEVVTNALADREARMESYQRRLEEDCVTIGSVSLPESWNDEMKMYPLYKLGAIASGIACEDSCIYDMEYGSTDLGNFRERVAKKPEEQFLVVVDFHF